MPEKGQRIIPGAHTLLQRTHIGLWPVYFGNRERQGELPKYAIVALIKMMIGR